MLTIFTETSPLTGASDGRIYRFCSENGTKLGCLFGPLQTMVRMSRRAKGELLQIHRILAELRKQRKNLNRAILALERLESEQRSERKTRARPPAEIVALMNAKEETVQGNRSANRATVIDFRRAVRRARKSAGVRVPEAPRERRLAD
jgi:hypothetical protein